MKDKSGSERVYVQQVGRGLEGHLGLVCDQDARGVTRLRHQSFAAPVHLSKPHHDGRTLVLNVANPTAGFLEGDRLRIDVQVEPDARLLLTAPSASRVHTMRAGHAEVAQHFAVAAGGSLEWWPELLIPQRGARYRQRTELTLATGAELLYFEQIAPGRTAMGEAFEFDDLRWSTDLRVDGRLLVRERSRWTPEARSLQAWRRRFPSGYYASAWLVSPALTAGSGCWEALSAMHGSDAWSGVSALGKNAFAWKLLAADSLALRRTMTAARRAIYDALDRLAPSLRRAGG